MPAGTSTGMSVTRPWEGGEAQGFHGVDNNATQTATPPLEPPWAPAFWRAATCESLRSADGAYRAPASPPSCLTLSTTWTNSAGRGGVALARVYRRRCSPGFGQCRLI